MVIGVDLDDTIADLIPSFIKFYNRKVRRISLTRDKIYTYRLWEVFGITRKEMTQRIKEFYSSYYHSRMKPVPGVVYACDYLCKNYDLVIISSRLEEGIDPAKKWTDRVFPNKFKDIYFANNSYAQDEKDKTKADICLELDIRVLIEDSLEYALECAEKGINVLLLDCPWNQSKNLPKKVTRVWNWREISSLFD